MNKILLDYIASKILEDVRKKIDFPDEFYDALAKSPLKESMREQVKESDIPIIKRLLKGPYTNKIVFGHILLRKLLHLLNIRELLEKLWNESKNIDLKIAIIYDLAEYTDLSREKLENFLNFLEKHRNIFEKQVIDWYDGGDKIIDGLLDKLKTESLQHKRWIYLHNLSVSSEKERAKEILKSYISDNDELVRKVANKSIERLNDKS